MIRSVLILTSSYPRFTGDPSGHFVESEARAWATAGKDVSIWAAGHGQKPEDGRLRVRWLGGGTMFGSPGVLSRLSEHPGRALAMLPVLYRMHRWIRRLPAPPDLVVAHWLPWAWLAVQFFPEPTRIEGVVHGSDVRLVAALPRLFRGRLLTRLARRGVNLRFVSAALRSELSRALPPDLRDYVHSGTVSRAAIELPALPDGITLRRELGLPRGGRHAVIVGRLVSHKRIDVALNALLLVPDLDVFVIGEGPDDESLKRRFPHAKFLGLRPRAETLARIKAADVLVSASRLEGAPTSIREARSLGTPVVSCDASDLRQWAETDPELHVIS